MSYTAPDLAEDVARAMTELGYTIPGDSADDDSGIYAASFGDYRLNARHGAHEALFVAVDDYLTRVALLQVASAQVLLNWEHGDLAGAVRELQSALDAMLPGGIDEFLESCREPV